jgi:DNA polymerase
MDTLQDLEQRVRDCTDCPLHLSRTNAVPGEGPADAEILFIGEGPGFHEDRQGRPFVGPAGNFLEELLQSIGMTRDQVYIANMVKCRPPDNRDPAPGEISACRKFLDRQIELIDPLLIITLGRFSMARFLPGQTISRVRGRLRPVDGRHIFPIMHPAAGLRRQEMRVAIEQDFAKVPGLLDVLRMQAEPASTPGIQEEPADYAADQPPPSLWGTLSTAPATSNVEPHSTESLEDPMEPRADDPPPGQQRLF